MLQTCLLDGAEWRAFRLFLADLEDRELIRIHRQLRREVAARQERDSDFTRLFFSSLQAADLQTVSAGIKRHHFGRSEGSQWLRPGLAGTSRRRPPESGPAAKRAIFFAGWDCVTGWGRLPHRQQEQEQWRIVCASRPA